MKTLSATYDKAAPAATPVRTEANSTIATIAVGLILLTLSESAMLHLFKSGLPRESKLFFIRNGEVFFSVTIAGVFFVASYLGSRGLLAALASLAITLAAFISFRGSWVWQGFFDRYEDSRGSWNLACLVGILAGGIIFGFNAFRKDRPRPATTLTRDASISVLAVLTLVSFFEARSITIDSAFESTRFIPLGITTLILIVFRFFSD